MTKANGGRVIELILDASSSMRSDERMTKAKEVLKKIVAEDLPDGMPVALRVYGARGGCDTDLVLPLTPLTAATRTQLQKTIEAVRASGSTNIAGSLDAVKDDLASASGTRHVVLVTDGGHSPSCGGDVMTSLENLKNLGIDVHVDIVGLAPPEAGHLHEEFKKWAAVTGGSYLSATDSPEMRKALTRVLIEQPPAPAAAPAPAPKPGKEKQKNWLDKIREKVEDTVEDVKEDIDSAIDKARGR